FGELVQYGRRRLAGLAGFELAEVGVRDARRPLDRTQTQLALVAGGAEVGTELGCVAVHVAKYIKRAKFVKHRGGRAVLMRAFGDKLWGGAPRSPVLRGRR